MMAFQAPTSLLKDTCPTCGVGWTVARVLVGVGAAMTGDRLLLSPSLQAFGEREGE
jgi:hypothetical protein